MKVQQTTNRGPGTADGGERKSSGGRGERGTIREEVVWGKWRKRRGIGPDISARAIARKKCPRYRGNVLTIK